MEILANRRFFGHLSIRDPEKPLISVHILNPRVLDSSRLLRIPFHKGPKERPKESNTVVFPVTY